jgi:hypothetical protein
MGIGPAVPGAYPSGRHILVRMGSVADAFRASLRERLMSLTADERVALTARLAESDVDIFSAVRQLPRDDARRLLRGSRSVGRRRSCANEVGP